MNIYLPELLHVVIGTSIMSVWLLRVNKASKYRTGHAQTLQEEFTIVGLPDWLYRMVRVFKPFVAFLLIVSIMYKPFKIPCLITVTLLMVGAVCSHIVVKDALIKYVPALLLLTMCIIALFYSL